jgi:hypothetical protein
MVQPNRLTSPGDTAARRRLEDLFARIDAGAVALPSRLAGDEGLEEVRQDAELAIERAGRGQLLDDALEHVRGTLVGGAPGEAAGMFGVVTMGRPEELASRVRAVSDLVVAAVAEDLVDRATVEALTRDATTLPARGPDEPAAGPETDPDGRPWMVEAGGPVDRDADRTARSVRILALVVVAGLVIFAAWILSAAGVIPAIG